MYLVFIGLLWVGKDLTVLDHKKGVDKELSTPFLYVVQLIHMNKWGYVYLILMPDGAYKIGYGVSAQKRLRQLQRIHNTRLYLIGDCRCYHPRLLEKYLHNKYGLQKDHRGEFFQLSDDDVLWIIAKFKTLNDAVIDAEKLNG